MVAPMKSRPFSSPSFFFGHICRVDGRESRQRESGSCLIWCGRERKQRQRETVHILPLSRDPWSLTCQLSYLLAGRQVFRCQLASFVCLVSTLLAHYTDPEFSLDAAWQPHPLHLTNAFDSSATGNQLIRATKRSQKPVCHEGLEAIDNSDPILEKR